MDAFVWLCGFDVNDLRIRKKRCRWQPPHWFTRLTDDAAVAHPFTRKRLLEEHLGTSAIIIALLRVEAGDVWRADSMQEWRKEAELLYKYPRPPIM